MNLRVEDPAHRTELLRHKFDRVSKPLELPDPFT
jgi:hypothetical protein